MAPMISIVIPAHNEESVIRRGLHAVLDGAAPGELEVIVVLQRLLGRHRGPGA